jgi:L,D-transpeptidase ErfK/SrfK
MGLAFSALASEPGQAQQELARALARLPAVFGQPKSYQRNGTEDVYRIARRFGVSASAIHNANTGDLTEGNELLLIPKEHIAPPSIADGIVVNLAERGLYLYSSGQPIRQYPVAIGRRGWETPTGEFTIANKAKNPTWFPPSWAVEEEPVPPGPDNPLGDRWMGLSVRGYGIHATNAASTVGRYLSHGCMRMYPEHARELYGLVKVGTPVTIVYRRIVFGYRPGTPSVYMAYHPDPYETGEVQPEEVRRELQEYGLEGVVDMEALAKALERPTGVPVPIIGSPTRVLVNGVPVELALGPTWVGGDWLVPAGPMAKALRAEMEMDGRRGYLIISRGGIRIFLVPGSPEALIGGQMVRLGAAPELAAGYPMIPLRAIVTALGGSVGRDESAQAILVWDGWARIYPPEMSLQ